MAPKSPDTNSLSPKTITELFNNLEEGDKLIVNNHKRAYEVIDTDTYLIIAEDPEGKRVTFTQNLQTGGWSINEKISYVETETK